GGRWRGPERRADAVPGRRPVRDRGAARSRRDDGARRRGPRRARRRPLEIARRLPGRPVAHALCAQRATQGRPGARRRLAPRCPGRAALGGMKPIIAVIGGSTATAAETALAEDTGRLLAGQGAVLVCGGLGGVMEAAARGAKANGGTTVGILPGADPALANGYIDVALATGLGEMGNFLILGAAHPPIALGGGVGTVVGM